MTKYLDGTGLTYLWGKITNLFSTKADKVAVVDHGTSDTTFTLTPNVLHRWDSIYSLNLTLGSGETGYMPEYMFEFFVGDADFVLDLPSSVLWVEQPTFQLDMGYQVSILDNVAIFVEF